MILKVVYGSRDLKILGIGLGWGIADSVMMNIAPLWMGALGLEFDWKYTIQSLECNLRLVQYLALTAVIFIYNKQYLQPQKYSNTSGSSNSPLSLVVILSFIVYPSIINYLDLVLEIGQFNLLLTHSLFTLSISLLTKLVLKLDENSVVSNKQQ
eukprot:gene6244-7775_t